jgi:hypothetical protein
MDRNFYILFPCVGFVGSATQARIGWFWFSIFVIFFLVSAKMDPTMASSDAFATSIRYLISEILQLAIYGRVEPRLSLHVTCNVSYLDREGLSYAQYQSSSRMVPSPCQEISLNCAWMDYYLC